MFIFVGSEWVFCCEVCCVCVVFYFLFFLIIFFLGSSQLFLYVEVGVTVCVCVYVEREDLPSIIMRAFLFFCDIVSVCVYQFSKMNIFFNSSGSFCFGGENNIKTTTKKKSLQVDRLDRVIEVLNFFKMFFPLSLLKFFSLQCSSVDFLSLIFFFLRRWICFFFFFFFFFFFLIFRNWRKLRRRWILPNQLKCRLLCLQVREKFWINVM